MQYALLGSDLKTSRVGLGTMTFGAQNSAEDAHRQLDLAPAYVASRSIVVGTIIGATTMAQLRDDIDACVVMLSDGVLKEIEVLYLRYGNAAP